MLLIPHIYLMENFMTLSDAVSTCFKKYATFDGIAQRSEYWWFFLFCILASAILVLLGDAVRVVFSIATLLPPWPSAHAVFTIRTAAAGGNY